jgi:hypothetical protein
VDLLPSDLPVDLINMQFALHYSFESEERAKRALNWKVDMKEIIRRA